MMEKKISYYIVRITSRGQYDRIVKALIRGGYGWRDNDRWDYIKGDVGEGEAEFIIRAEERNIALDCGNTHHVTTPHTTEQQLYSKLKLTQSNMCDIVKHYKGTKLTADEKLLRKVGILNDDGSLSDDGKAVVEMLQVDAFTAKLVEIAKDYDKDKKKK